jgi:hypothetical protein
VDPLSAAAPALAVTKNNRMELAVIEALQRPAKVTLRTDSKYLLDLNHQVDQGLAAQRLEDRSQEAGQGRRPVARAGGRDKPARCHRGVGEGSRWRSGNERADAPARHRRGRHHGPFRPGNLSGACVIRNAARR